jgi:hypothetical protein
VLLYFLGAQNKENTDSSTNPTLDIESGWNHILAVYQVPELNVDQYVDEAIATGSYLLLYTLLLHRRPLCQSANDERKMMEDIFAWTGRIQPT